MTKACPDAPFRRRRAPRLIPYAAAAAFCLGPAGAALGLQQSNGTHPAASGDPHAHLLWIAGGLALGLLILLGLLVAALDRRRRRAEEALVLAREKLDKVFQASPVWITITTQDEGRFLDVNRAFTRITGYQRSEVIGRAVEELGFWRDISRREQIVRKALQEGEALEKSAVLRMKDGRLRNVLFSIVPIVLDGQACFINVIQDITRRVMIEERLRDIQGQLIQSQKLEAIGSLTSGLAHEFNNLLQVLGGQIQIMASRPGLSQEDRRNLELMDATTQRAGSLVRRVLAFGRRDRPLLRLVNLNLETTRTIRMLEMTLPRMIRMELDLAPDLPMMRGDAAQLELVLLNLGSNAADAMPRGGVLRLETACVQSESCPELKALDAEPGGYLRLRASDTGQGMDEETQRRIFEPFFTTKEAGKGTGLGLSMVQRIIRNHGGRISCTSQPGKGSVFSLYFPVSSQADEAGAADAPHARIMPRGSETILLVDDEEAILDMAGEILKANGYAILTADSGEEALEVYRRQGERIGLVVLDLGMPGMGGRQCLDELLGLDPEAKVLIASGYAARKQVRETLESGAAGFLAKPYRLDELATEVRRILDGPEAGSVQEGAC